MPVQEETSIATVAEAVPDAIRLEEPPSASPFDEAVEFGVLESLIGYHLRLADDRVFESFASRLGEERPRPGLFTTLTLIVNNPGITQVVLARASGRDKSSITKDLRFMEDDGLVRRERVDDDRRSFACFATDAGRDLCRRLTDEVRIHGEHLTSILGPERREMLLKILKDLINGLP